MDPQKRPKAAKSGQESGEPLEYLREPEDEKKLAIAEAPRCRCRSFVKEICTGEAFS